MIRRATAGASLIGVRRSVLIHLGGVTAFGVSVCDVRLTGSPVESMVVDGARWSAEVGSLSSELTRAPGSATRSVGGGGPVVPRGGAGQLFDSSVLNFRQLCGGDQPA